MKYTDTQDHIDFNANFERWLEKNPGGTFSEFSVARIAAGLKVGNVHNSLGSKLVGDISLSEHGEGTYKKILSCANITKKSIICDYGCGSLRIGAHFMKTQDPSCFIGMDVSMDFIDYGIEEFKDLIKDKTPLLGTINDTLERAVEKEPELTLAANVVCHIHPDETDVFYDNLKRLARNPKNVTVLQVLIYDTPVRYKRSGWAWPLEYYIKAMAPMVLKEKRQIKPFESGGYMLQSVMLSFCHEA